MNEVETRFSPRVTGKGKKGGFPLAVCFLMCKWELFPAQESLQFWVQSWCLSGCSVNTNWRGWWLWGVGSITFSQAQPSSDTHKGHSVYPSEPFEYGERSSFPHLFSLLPEVLSNPLHLLHSEADENKTGKSRTNSCYSLTSCAASLRGTPQYPPWAGEKENRRKVWRISWGLQQETWYERLYFHSQKLNLSDRGLHNLLFLLGVGSTQLLHLWCLAWACEDFSRWHVGNLRHALSEQKF